MKRNFEPEPMGPDNEVLEYAIHQLIQSGHEGAYWDFKASWLTGAGLLHRIICMANNLEDRDSYLIIGIDENQGLASVDLTSDENRLNTNELVNFLRDKKFLGGMRPEVSVRHVEYLGSELDIIEVKNSKHTPFMLVEEYTDKQGQGNKKVRANNIYTRVQDTNTPIDKSADLDKIEYLWRKRFGIDKTALERLSIFLDNPADWVYQDHRAMFYYKYAPEFVIEIARLAKKEDSPHAGDSAYYRGMFPDSRRFHLEDFEVKYFGTVIHEGVCAYLDGGRHLVVDPEQDFITESEFSSTYDDHITLHYYDSSSIDGKIAKVFTHHYTYEDPRRSSPIASVTIEFQSEAQKDDFKNYVLANLKKFPQLQTLAQFQAAGNPKDDEDNLDSLERWERDMMRELRQVFTDWQLSNGGELGAGVGQ